MDIIPIHLRNQPPPAEKFDHVNFILELAKFLQPNIYLECGVRNSPVLTRMVKVAKTCIGVDLNPCHITSPNLEFHQMSTDDFFEKVLKETPRVIEMVFIDADHSYEASLRDFDNVFPYVMDDGLIFLHDTYPINEKYTQPNFCHDSYKTAWHIRTKYRDKCEILTLPFQPGLSIVRKSQRQLYWNYDLSIKITNFIIYDELSHVKSLDKSLLNNFKIEPTNNLANSDQTLFVGIVQDPYYWLDSLYRSQDKDIDQFLNSEYESEKNVFEYRKVSAKYLLNMRQKVRNYILIRYEDLTNNYYQTLKMIEDKFDLQPKTCRYIEIETSKDDSKLVINSESVTERFDWNLEKNLGYLRLNEVQT